MFRDVGALSHAKIVELSYICNRFLCFLYLINISHPRLVLPEIFLYFRMYLFTFCLASMRVGSVRKGSRNFVTEWVNPHPVGGTHPPTPVCERKSKKNRRKRHFSPEKHCIFAIFNRIWGLRIRGVFSRKSLRVGGYPHPQTPSPIYGRIPQKGFWNPP